MATPITPAHRHDLASADNPLAASADPSRRVQGYVDAILTAVLMASAVVIMADSIYRWVVRLRTPGEVAANA